MGKRLQIDRAKKASGLQVCLRTFNTSPGAGLQIDSSSRTYRRIPISDLKKPKFLDFPMSN